MSADSEQWFRSPYDDVCDRLKTALHADGLVVLVIGGKHGSHISVRLPEKVHANVPGLLRAAAQSFEEEYSRQHGPQTFCPVCHGHFKFHESAEPPNRQPEPGDITICGGCGSLLRFTNETTLRLAETEEIALMTDEQRNALVRARREIERRRR